MRQQLNVGEHFWRGNAMLSLIVVFVVAFVVWGIGGLMFRSVRDHLRQ